MEGQDRGEARGLPGFRIRRRACSSPSVRQYCHARVLSLIKRRTLAGLRKSVEPVEQVAYARFLPEWQGVGSGQRGTDAVLSALEQLSGYALPASAVEAVVLPARVANYSPAMLDELTSTGEVYWVGDGAIGDADGWVRWYLADQEPHPPPDRASALPQSRAACCTCRRWRVLLRFAAPVGIDHSRSI